jgi:hypothetical protein
MVSPIASNRPMKTPAFRNPRRPCLLFLCGLAMAASLNSCANLDEHEKEERAREREEARREKDELKERLAFRNERYTSLQDRRRMRAEAREERYQAWWDRIMH